MKHRFVDGKSGLVREDASRETRDAFLDAVLVTGTQDVVIDEHVVAEKVQLGPHVGEQASHARRQVDDVGGLVPGEDCVRRTPVPQIALLGRQPHPPPLVSRLLDGRADPVAHQP